MQQRKPSRTGGGAPTRSVARLVALALFAALAVAGAAGLAHAADDVTGANPFRDVPPDHWSVKAIQQLVREGLVEGFPDGTFKGNKVITRYDLAIHVARILAKMDEFTRQGGAVSPEDAVTITRLTNEYKAELDLLGVKVDRLEKRLQSVEDKADRLDKALSNVRIEGFYRAEQVFVDEPFDFTGYPYSAYQGENPNSGLTKSGLYNLSQTAYLRFIGQPVVKGEKKKDIEAFVEIKGVISGLSEDRLTYRFSDPPVAGDGLDDFATGLEDQRRVSLNKAHLKINSARMNIRAFANEAITDLKDPFILLTGDASALTYSAANSTKYAPWTEDFSFDQGVEFEGAHKKFGYFGSVVRDQWLDGVGGNNPYDLTEEFAPTTDGAKDVYALRLTYDVFKKAEGKAPNNLTFGASYVETIWSYDTRDDFNRVLGYDFQFAHDADGHKFELTLNPLLSEGKGTVHDTGFKADSSYRYGKLLATFKGYTFGRNFQAVPAARPWVDYSLNRSFRRNSVVGEEFTRTQIKYDLGNHFMQGVEDLTLTLMHETKRFERDPAKPLETDEITGTRTYLQALADLTDKTHVEWKGELQKDVLPGEEGCWTHTLNLDVKVWDETSMVGELTFIDDYDQVGADRRHYAQRAGKFSVNSQLSKTLFASGYVETIKNAKDSARAYTNGRDENAVGGEFTVNVRSDLSLKGWGERREVEDNHDHSGDGTTDALAGEFAWNFTRALKFRAVHGFKDTDLVTGKDDFVINNFAELFYRPTEQTELRFSYGYEYENPSDGWDDGVLEFWRTNKVWRLTAQTDF